MILDKNFYWQCSKCSKVLIQSIPIGLGASLEILDLYGSSYFQDEEKTKINPIITICDKCNGISLHIPIQASRNQLIKKIKRFGYQEIKYRIQMI